MVRECGSAAATPRRIGVSSARFRAAESWSLHGRNALEKTGKPHQPLGPGTEPARCIECSGFAGIDEFRAPGLGEGAGAPGGAMRVVPRSDQHGGERQGGKGRRAEILDRRRRRHAFGIRSSDEIGTDHRAEFGSGGRCTGSRHGTRARALRELTGRVACATASPRRATHSPACGACQSGWSMISPAVGSLRSQRASHRSSSGPPRPGRIRILGLRGISCVPSRDHPRPRKGIVI